MGQICILSNLHVYITKIRWSKYDFKLKKNFKWLFLKMRYFAIFEERTSKSIFCVIFRPIGAIFCKNVVDVFSL